MSDPGLADYVAALDGLRQALQADGADLELLDLEGGTLRARLVFGPDCCRECILPPETLKAFMLNELRKATAGIERVELERPPAERP
jgi:hypothetical protein